MKIKQLLNSAVLFSIITVLGTPAFCENISQFNGSYNGINNTFGGAINTHDMMMLREKERLLNEKRDFETLNERKNKSKNKKDNVIDSTNIKTYKIYNKETSLKYKENTVGETSENDKAEKKTFFKRNKKNKKKSLNEASNEIPVAAKTTIEANIEKQDIKKDSIFVKGISINESGILSDEEIQLLADSVIEKNVTFNDLENLVQNFNYIFAQKGYVTARAFIPPQTIENGIVKIELVEGTIGKITFENNKWTKTSYIKKRINQKEGSIFDVAELEQDIVKFNKYNDRINLKASLYKGEVEGTTDVKIEAKEDFPFHIMGVMDNAGRKTIGELRGGLMLSADSLLGYRDKLSLGTYVSKHSITPFADYNIPVNKKDGRVGFTFSSSFANVGEGPYKIFDIESRSFNYALYYTHPLVRKPHFELTSYSAINYKQASTSFSGVTIYTDKISSFETALNARIDTKRGIWYINQGVYQAFPIFSEESKYFKYTGNIVRLHDFGKGIVGQLRGMYQFSPKDVMPYIDQFQAGGLASVRGYSEGLLIGRSGYLLSGELMFPIAPQKITIKRKGEKAQVPFLGQFVKGLVFVDHAGVMPFKGEGPGKRSINQSDYMISMGFGLRINLPGDAQARLYWACPLMHNPNEIYYRNPRFSFEISLSPDFDKILKWKKDRDDAKLKQKELL